MIKKWVMMNYSIDLPCSPKVSGYEYYDDFGTPLLMNFDAVDAVLTIRNVWVIFSAH